MKTPPETPDWQILPPETAKSFLKAVQDEAFSGLFAGDHYELWAKNLVFSDGYSQYSLANQAMMPYFTLDFVSNGENHYYLDGSELPVSLLIEREALRLNTDNILHYLDFFDDVVFDPARKVKFSVHAHDTGHAGPSAMKHHFRTMEYFSELKISHDPKTGHFDLHLPVLLNSESVKGHVQVEESGKITILKPVRADLMDREHQDRRNLRYQHPHEATILDENRAILEKSETGARLLEVADHYGAKIRIITGIGHRAFAPSAAEAFIVVPYYVERYSPYQLLDLAGVLREVELQLLEEKRPAVTADPDDYTTLNCARNLDVLLYMCKMVEELDAAGYPEILQAFRKSGFEAIYSGYKNQTPLEDLFRVYSELMGIPTKD